MKDVEPSGKNAPGGKGNAKSENKRYFGFFGLLFL
jgi:hypothetical protein